MSLLILFCSAAGTLAEEVDRLLAAVNGSVITEGDLYIFRAYRNLASDGEGSRTLSRRDEIDRLINLELIRQELENLNIEPGDEGTARARYDELRDRYQAPGGAEALSERLGIDATEVVSFLRLEISIEKLVEFRFRPFVRVSEEEIEAYYKDTLAPPLETAGVALPPLESVSAEIERNIKEEKVNEELEQWIGDARRGARIEYFEFEGDGAPAPGSPGKVMETGTME